MPCPSTQIRCRTTAPCWDLGPHRSAPIDACTFGLDMFRLVSLGLQSYLLRRWLDPPNPPQTPSQRVLGALGFLFSLVPSVQGPERRKERDGGLWSDAEPHADIHWLLVSLGSVNTHTHMCNDRVSTILRSEWPLRRPPASSCFPSGSSGWTTRHLLQASRLLPIGRRDRYGTKPTTPVPQAYKSSHMYPFRVT